MSLDFDESESSPKDHHLILSQDPWTTLSWNEITVDHPGRGDYELVK